MASGSNQSHWLITLSLMLGATVFIWLSLEDKSVLVVSILGVSLSMLCTIVFYRKRQERFVGAYCYMPLQRGIRHYFLYIISGTLGGAGAILAILLLMLIKTSMHSHVFPDYSLAIMAAMLARLPAWSMAGGLIGGALALLNHSSST